MRNVKSDLILAWLWKLAATINQPSCLRFLISHNIWYGSAGPSPSHSYTTCRKWERWRPPGQGRKKGGITPIVNDSSQKWKVRLLLTFHWPALGTWHQFTNWGRGYKVQRRAGGRHLCRRFYWKATDSMSVFVCARAFIMKIYFKKQPWKSSVFKIKIWELSVSPFQVTLAPALEDR